MPARVLPLVTNEIYHIINRGNASVPIFKVKHDHQRFIQTFLYYQNINPPIRFSKFTKLNNTNRGKILRELKEKKKFLVELIAYCLMPNHFHFLLRQNKEDGILNFIRLSTNSYSRYFNTKYRRRGSLFEGRFKAVRIETDNQLLHVSRYIHLNPYSSYLVKNFESLLSYPFSSLPEYLGNVREGVCQKEIILEHFPNAGKYKEFVSDRADYQRSLEEIKHQLLED